MNHEQHSALLDASISWLESQCEQALQYEPIFNGCWHYLDRQGKQGYNGAWYEDTHGNTRLKLTYHTFKRSGFSDTFDDFAVIQGLRDGKRVTYQRRKPRPKAPAPTKPNTTAADIAQWRSSSPVGMSAYLQRKHIDDVPCDALRYRSGNISLLLAAFADAKHPAMVAKGTQAIYPNGRKQFSAGLVKRGAFILVGSYPAKGDTVFICEGFATAASVHQATGAPTFAALDAGNLQHVARAIKKHCADVSIIIAGDNDKSQTGQKSAHHAALLVRGMVALPDDVGDFNDVHTRDGLQAARRQLAPVMPDVALAFADDKQKHIKRLQAVNASSGRYLPTINELKQGVTIVRAPQGTGKTYAMQSLIDEYRAQGLRVLYLTHRVSLARDAARRLNLQHYEDVTGDYVRAVGSLAMCVNSLPRLRDVNGLLSAFDIIIIDESEQLTRALSGAHIANKKTVLTALESMISGAGRVVCLDADAGLLTARLLQHYRPNEQRRHYITHHHEVGAGRVLNVHDDKADVFGLLGRLTEPAFIVTNSKHESERVHVYLQSKGKNGALINGDTSADEQVLLANIDRRARAQRLDYVVCSPSISTGVSLESGYFTHVFGLFHSSVATPADALQAVWRVRTPAQYHIWLDTRTISEHIDLSARYGALIDNEQALLARAVGVRDDAYEDIKRLTDSYERQQQTAFRLGFLQLANRQGFTVNLQQASGAYDGLLKQINEMVTVWRDDAIEHSERHELTRQVIRDFYRVGTDEPLRPWITLDNGGKYRRRIARLERAVSTPEQLQKIADELLTAGGMAADFTPIASERTFIRQVLQAVRFFDAAQYIDESPEPEQQNLPRYDTNSLQGLLQWIESNRAWLSGLVALPAADKLTLNPLRYISSWLKRAGLKQVRVGKRHKGMYALQFESLFTACQVLQQRGVTLSLEPTQKSVTPAAPPEPEQQNLPSHAPKPAPEHWQQALKKLLNRGLQDDIMPLATYRKLAQARQDALNGDTNMLNAIQSYLAMPEVNALLQ